MKYRYTKEILEDAAKNSTSWKEMTIKIGGCVGSGGMRAYLKKSVEEFNIDVSHFYIKDNLYSAQRIGKLPADYHLVKNKTNYRVKSELLRRCMLEKGVEYKCSFCGISDWREKELALEVDHINEDWADNRLENLRFLCPNCHSQETKKQTNRNKKKYYCVDCYKIICKKAKRCRSCSSKKNNPRKVKNRPSIEQLKKDIKDLGYCGTGRKYGVTDNTIRKWMKHVV